MSEEQASFRTKQRAIRLSAEDRDRVINAIEHAINGGWDELRVYWPDGEVHSAPIRIGKRAA